MNTDDYLEILMARVDDCHRDWKFYRSFATACLLFLSLTLTVAMLEAPLTLPNHWVSLCLLSGVLFLAFGVRAGVALHRLDRVSNELMRITLKRTDK